MLRGEALPARRPTTKREPEPAPTKPGVPAGIHIAHATTAPSSSEGKLIVSGQDYVGVYDDGQPLFAPPEAVALALGKGELFAWRQSKRASTSGISRGDYDWTLEIYSWPGKSLISHYTLTTRHVIANCWPDSIRCAAKHRYRLVTFKALSEDYPAEIHVVRNADGTFFETTDRAAALAHCK